MGCLPGLHQSSAPEGFGADPHVMGLLILARITPDVLSGKSSWLCYLTCLAGDTAVTGNPVLWKPSAFCQLSLSQRWLTTPLGKPLH